MRPTGLESIRAVRAALTETIVPELTSAFAQDAAGTLQALLESIAGEWDTAADDLRRDNQTLVALISASRTAIERVRSRNETLSSIVTEIESHLPETESSLTLSKLASRNDALTGTLEHILVAFEELTGQAGFEEIDEMRRRIYAHLRDVAARGWSFWDVSSFRERMETLRSVDAGR